MIPEFCIVVGSMKCGTTSLFSYLSQHPEIAPCKVKEPNYFAQHYDRGFDWYQSLWDWDPGRHRIALEASTNYTKIPMFPNAAERIACAPGRYRFIYCVRNPLDAIESAYNHGRAQGWLQTEVPLEDEIPKSLLLGVRYATQIGEYGKRFGRESILAIDHREFDREPHQVLRRICQFAGVAANHEFDVSLRRNLSSDWLAQPVKATGKVEPKSQLRDAQRVLVVRELREELDTLRVEYGIDVDAWHLEPS